MVRLDLTKWATQLLQGGVELGVEQLDRIPQLPL